MQSSFTSGRSRRCCYRPVLDRLEDRLPPGDAVLAGLLAHELFRRATGLNPVVSVAPTGQARRLANPSILAEGDTFALLPSITEQATASAGSPRPTRPAQVDHADAEPFAPAAGVRREPSTVSAPAEPITPDAALSRVVVAGSAGMVPAANFATPAPGDYRLDQAVAALALRTADREGTLSDGDGTRGAPVRALFDLGHPTTGPFPSNWFTVFDDTQNTWRRVNLPYPDCSVYVSDCEDIAVLNELDGFNLQPRLSVPFSGPIDVHSVNYTNVFLVSLGSTTKEEGFMPRGYGVGINQVVWDVASNTLHVESDELLAQHTRFALYVTNGVRDAQGDPVRASRAFRTFRETVQGDYREHLHDAMLMAGAYGFRERDIVTASVFTTRSATAMLEKVRDQIKVATPEPADFLLGPGQSRTVFSRDNVTGIRWIQQIGDNPPVFSSPVNLNLTLLDIFPGAVGEVAFGKYVSPDYRVHPGEYIPPVETRTGTPVVQGLNEVQFTLYLPSGPRPAGGWPVAIVAHGGGQNRHTFPLLYASRLAAHGIATISINAVGFGFGPLGTLTVNRTAGAPVTFLSGGRSFDQDGDGDIVQREGDSSTAPRTILLNTDGHRQTAADLMQLVRVIGVGIDVHGDGDRDLDPSRIYYFGLSYSGFHGTMFLAVEPDVHAGALNVTGGPYIDLIRMRNAPAEGRALVGQMLAGRVPSLLNAPGVIEISGIRIDGPFFDENWPLRNGVSFSVRLEGGATRDIQSPVVNDVPGAMAIQELIDRMRWVQHAASPPAYAPHLRRSPLPGVPAKSVLYQFPKGDQTIANPWQTATVRAGHLADRATFYRHDLAYAEDPDMPRDPHGFVNMITHANAYVRLVAQGYQDQIATFFESDGKTIIHPEPARFFEVPIVPPLPEGLNFIT